MTKNEFNKICKIIDSHKKLIYANYNSPIMAINGTDIERIKEEIKEMIKK